MPNNSSPPQPQASTSAGNQDVLLRRKKADRACDYCRKRKARCAWTHLHARIGAERTVGDADPLSGRTCMNCTLNQVECTFDDTMKVRAMSLRDGSYSHARRNKR